MGWFERIATWIVILAIVGMFGFIGLESYDCVGIKTSTGEAVVTGCTYTPLRIVGKVAIPENWKLWMRIGSQETTLNVTERTCRSPVGTVYRVKYGYGRRNGDLIIKDFAP